MGEAPGDLADVLECPPELLDLLMQCLRLGCRHQPTLDALEELHPALPRRARQQFADRRLGDVEELGGAGDTAGQHHRPKHFHVAQVHRVASDRFSVVIA